jgi:hypothetical protein
MKQLGKAFRGSQARGQKGFGAQTLGELALNRDERPQSVGKVYKNANQGAGERGFGTGDLDKDPLTPFRLGTIPGDR